MPTKPYLRVLGSADWLPTPGNDSASYTISDEMLIDTGWSGAVNLINQGIDPLRINTLLFTHMHADHCMALPQFVLYWRIKRNSLAELTIAGPAPSVRMAFERAFAYIFHDSDDVTREVLGYPRIVELHGGDAAQIGDYDIKTCDASHAAPGLCYRIAHRPTGRAVGFSGDTQYTPAFGPFFQDCELLVHETSFGAGPIDPESNRICKHSSAREAARVAREARVKKLMLTHSVPDRREASVAQAGAMLDIPVLWAEPHHVFDL